MNANPTPDRDEEVTGSDYTLLVHRLKRFRLISLRGEESRRARDRKGAKLARSEMWDLGITRNRQAITSNLALELIEKRNATLTRNKPTPQVEAVQSADDDAAALLQGGIHTNWALIKMQEKLKQGMDQCTYTRPVGWYSFWDTDLRAGIGDRNTRLIPGWRLIVDDRVLHVRDMEFVGFREEATRAKLIQLFPDKADDIEQAANLAAERQTKPGMPDDPLRADGGGLKTDAVLDRNVVNMPQSYLGKTSVATRRDFRKRSDPLADNLEVEYLWYRDPTPLKVLRPQLTKMGHPKRELVTDEETGEVQFDVHGWDVANTPFGPLHTPNLKPKTRPVYETVIRKKYPEWRHIAWVPHDDLILWDVAWNGPVPIAIQRDSIPISGFHSTGTAQRLFDLALARNVLYTIIFERLKLSLGGAWMATKRSGLKANKLTPESGQVYQVNSASADDIKQFPVQPLDAAYFNLLDKIEGEMSKLMGLSEPMQGQAAGRADSPATYDKLIEAGGVTLVNPAQFLEETIHDWCEQGLWFMQNYYTHEHYVEMEQDDGSTSWRSASALMLRGDFSVTIETGSMIAYSESQMFQRAQQYAALGFYALPMLGKVGHVPFWRQGLKQKMQIAQDPQKAAILMGPGGAAPAQQQKTVQSTGRRSHHAPGGH